MPNLNDQTALLKIKICSITSTLNNLIDDLPLGAKPEEADILLVGGKKFDLDDFPRLKGIFKCGVGRDNIPIKEAYVRQIKCGFPSQSTSSIIHDETANYTCHLILKHFYSDIGDFNKWTKKSRNSLSLINLLVVGCGNIGSRVAVKLKNFMNVDTFDIQNNSEHLERLVRKADYISLHLPLTENTSRFFDKEKLGWIKDGACLVNTARAAIVCENALHKELSHGRIKAAFDVFWNEPYKGKLLNIQESVFTRSPHVASNCQEFLNSTAQDFRIFLSELLKEHAR